ncbi:choice-of-anchor A family protein [Polaribacter litorisediminis]|uniref:collagen-binding domain-containing protein n=1 Tax=Polaribacter litorisediminis TaxID=1908341 RepID=UPI001CC1785B|nr:collagen-binding domain-containing protein [Polaribacter litorisediminis]UAM97519.1 choice-of-anchor A family protein [Polaribacter litorisediminis]
MNLPTKITLLLMLFFVSTVQINHANNLTDTHEFINDASQKENSVSFYEAYNANWTNIKNDKRGHLWNTAAPKTIETLTSELDDKKNYLAANGYSSKPKNKITIKSSKSFSNSEVCSPETSLRITQGTRYGISRSTLNNSGVPSFCLALGIDAPSENEIYFTTLTPDADISFENELYTKAEIRELVQRTVSLIYHPDYAPSDLPVSLFNNFYLSIQYVIWHWTNNVNVDMSASWVANDGQTYNASHIKDWVLDGTLSAANVFWMIPANNSTQPEVLWNQTSRPAPEVTEIAICSDDTYQWLANGVTYNGSDGNTTVTIEGSSSIKSQDAIVCAANQILNITVTQKQIADNITSSSTMAENQTKILEGNPSGGTWSIISGGGILNGSTYTPDDISINTEVTIRYTIAADGSCGTTTDDVTFTVNTVGIPYTPTSPADCFSVFVENNATLTSGHTNGSLAVGGDVTINGTYGVGSQDCGCFENNGNKLGLLVGGQVNYTSGVLTVSSASQYAQIGVSNGSNAWYVDPENAPTPIRITPESDYNASSYIQLMGNAAAFNASAGSNAVFAQNIIDFSLAFQELRTNSISMSENAHNVSLEDNAGNSIANTVLPSQVEVFLNKGTNYMNITGADLNSVQTFTTQNHPDSDKVLVINVDAPGVFYWDVWSQGGIADQDAPNVLYNFYNTTELHLEGSQEILGTVYAPFAEVIKTVNTTAILGQVIASSFTQDGGDIECANFTAEVKAPAPPSVAPIAAFNVNNNECLTSNTFVFNNVSNTGLISQPLDPISYTWDFGDGTSSALMNPTKKYASAGTYMVTLSAMNSFGTDTITAQVTVLPVADAIITMRTRSSGNGSVNKDFTLENPTAYTSYSWSLPGEGSVLYPNQAEVNFAFSEAGMYTLTLTGINSNGCSVATTFPFVIESSEVSSGNGGGVESESLGDAISKIYVSRKKNSVPTEFVKSSENVYNKKKMKSLQPYQGKGQTMLDMFPSELVAGNVANITSPTDILDYTVADEVLSVDFSLDGKTKGVVLGIKTSDKIYNHTKASCDRLRGAEILNIQTVQLEGYNFLMQGIKQRNGLVEYAISFATAKNNNDNRYTLQTNWYVNAYTKFNDVYNFQVWSTNPEDTKKLVSDILANLKTFIPINQTEIQKVPETYAAKISRDKADLVILLRSTKTGLNTEISMEELYSETANNVKYRYNPVNTALEQVLKIDIKDGYEYDALVKVNGEIEDAFYHADGNWGLDYDKQYTEVKNYFVSNNFNREYQDDEHPINRNIEITATSEYDYLTVYKSLLPGTLSADYSEYNYVAFTAKGSGLMELGLIKSSIEDWKSQYRVMVDFSEEEQTYYVPFDVFTSSASQENMTAEDLTTLTFTFLPVEAQTKELDLTISDVRFTKTAVESQTVQKIEKFENEFMAYPNPSKGNVNLLLFSETDTEAAVTLSDITGKVIYRGKAQLTAGKNELEFDFKVKTGVMLLQVNSAEVNYGTSKIIFK